MTGARFRFVCRNSRKSAISTNVLEVFTRATFLVYTRDSSSHNVAVANDFLHKSYPRARILLQLSMKPIQNT